MREGEAFRRGVRYEIANGIRIPNLGEKEFTGLTEDGVQSTLIAQVCKANKGLLSVRQMTKNGHRVVFEENQAYIEDMQNGEKIWMFMEGGMYAIKLYVPTGF